MWPTLLFVLLMGVPFDPTHLTVPIAYAEPEYDFTSTTTVRAYIASSTPLKRALLVADGESGFVYNQRGDMHITCWKAGPNYGKPVVARGVWQITRCFFEGITDEQADSVEWSTAWALPRLKDKQLCIQTWTVCKELFSI